MPIEQYAVYQREQRKLRGENVELRGEATHDRLPPSITSENRSGIIRFSGQLLAECPPPTNPPAQNEVQDCQGHITEAIQAFTTTKQWDPNLTFDSVARAQELTNTTKSPKNR
jgi:hypothetical protein